MKKFLYLTLILIAISCQKNEYDDLIGNWVNEQKDTITFLDSRFLEFKSYNPYFTTLYDYSIKEDSISLFPAHSSNLKDRECYFFSYSNEIIELFEFRNIEKAVYTRLKTD